MAFKHPFSSATQTLISIFLQSPVIFFLSFLVMGMSGCASEQLRVPMLPPESLQNAAILFCQAGTPIVLFAVDGVEGTEDPGPPFNNRGCYGSTSAGGFVLKLKPGTHILEVSYRRTMPFAGLPSWYSPQPIKIELDAEAGRKYTIISEVRDGLWDAKVFDVTDEKAQE